jgi:hypothetical protein
VTRYGKQGADMTSNTDPDKKTEGAESTEDEEIIELKEEAADMSQDDEEIIDLLEATDEPDVEGIKQGVVAQEPESAQDPEIIEIEEETFNVLQNDEEVIDLLEVADTPQEIEEIGEPIHTTAKPSEEAEDLADLHADLLEKPGVLDDELGREVAADQDLSDDFVDSLGMELDSKEDISEDVLEPEKVSEVQMEAALERVIKKMFYEKIDGILVEVIEKTVTREIERLKNVLLQDASGNEK